MTEFDSYARDYNRILADNVSVFGEDVFYFARHKASYLAQFVIKEPAPRILDFGCGIGNLSLALREQLPQAVIDGFDISDDSLSHISKELREKGIFSSDLGALESGYDLAVMAGVLHHIPMQERLDTLEKVTGLLRPGGQLVAIEHNPINPLTRRVVADCVFDKDAILLRPGEVMGYLRALGLVAVHRNYFLFFPRPLSLFRPLEHWLAWCPLGAQYAVQGEKADAG